ncbi:MAG: shikimate dehydrogenase [Flavobacteriaceae bacterium]
MAKTGNKKHRYGLVGKNIAYSFSRSYFTNKFQREGLEDYDYVNFDLENIDEFPLLLQSNKRLRGLNVTIPYKEAIIPYLDEIEPQAAEIGAVNTIEFSSRGLKGHNTDVYGFKESISGMLGPGDQHALILGTGGASKAIAYVLGQLGIEYRLVSRSPADGQLSYQDLGKEIMSASTLIVNCTPLGTFPDIQQKPALPYSLINHRHLLYDLIYNPTKTLFLKEGEQRGARILNGLRMLELQAEKSWEIWNNPIP